MKLKWWFIPPILWCIIAFIPWMQEVRRANQALDELILAEAPAYSRDQAVAESRWLIKHYREWEERKSAPDDPLLYWEALGRQKMLESAIRRMLASDEYHVFASALLRNPNWQKISLAQHYFNARFGADKMLSVRPDDLYMDGGLRQYHIESSSVEKFIEGYLWSIPAMLFFFVIRLKVRELLVLVELWRLVPAAVFWPAGLFLYPRDIRREEQIRNTLYFMAQFASIVLALMGGFGPLVVVVKAQTGKKGGSTKTERSESRHSLGIGTEIYPLTDGPDDGWVASPYYVHKHKLGNGVTVSGFGFAEIGENMGNRFFTNNAASLNHERSMGTMATIEVGGSATAHFVQIGPRVSLLKIPGVNRGLDQVADSVVVGFHQRIRGPTPHFSEWFISWDSKEVRLPFGILGSTEGFMRWRPGPTPAVGQPQLIFSHPRLKHTRFAVESWWVGTRPTWRIGLQFAK